MLLSLIVFKLIWFHGLFFLVRLIVTIVMAEMKDDFYCNQFSTNMFLPLGVEVFGCLH